MLAFSIADNSWMVGDLMVVNEVNFGNQRFLFMGVKLKLKSAIAGLEMIPAASKIQKL